MDGGLADQTGPSVDRNHGVTEHAANRLKTTHSSAPRQSATVKHDGSKSRGVCAVPGLPQQGAVSVEVTEEPQLHTEHRNERKDLKDGNSNTAHTWTDRQVKKQTGEVLNVNMT